jgi:hypothetical protein
MSVRATIKRGDTGQVFTATLTVDGAAQDLTDATVYFVMSPANGGTVIKEEATVTDATAGQVEYLPVADDVATAGRYRIEWEVELPGGRILTFPSGSYNELTILDDLG